MFHPLPATHMYLSCLAFLGYVLFAHRRGALPFGYLPLCALAVLVPGGFAAALAGGFDAYRTGAGILGLLLLAATTGEILWTALRDAQNAPADDKNRVKASGKAEYGAGGTVPNLEAGKTAAGPAGRPVGRDSGEAGSPEPASGDRRSGLEAGLFSVALLALPWYFQGVGPRYYDEFFWGNLLKALLADGRLLTAASPLSGTGVPLLNPPGPALLGGMFMPHGFDETGMAVGGMALVLALGSAALHLMRPRLGLLRALLLAVLCCCLARCMGTLHEGIHLVGYTEYLQASVFAALLAVAVFEPDARRRAVVLTPGAALLTLFKATGFLFGLGVVAVAAVTAWDDPFPPGPEGNAATGPEADAPRRRTARARRVLSVALPPLLAIFAAKSLWDWHLHTFLLQGGDGGIAARMAADAARTLSDLGAEALSATSAAPGSPATRPAHFHWEAFKALAAAFYSRPLLYSPLIPESAMTVLAGTLSLLIQWGVALRLSARRLKTRPPRAQSRALTVLLAGLFGWIAVRYIVSVQGHTAAEALRAASYERYIGAYMAGCAVLVTLIVHRRLAALPGRAARLSLPLLAAQTLLTLLICGALPPWPRPGTIPPSPVRAEMERAAALLAARTPPGSRIWFIAQNADNQKAWALRYLAAPERLVGLPPDSWSLGAPYDAADRYSKPLSPERLRVHAGEFGLDYLLLWDYDARFLREYGPVLGLSDVRDGLLLDLKDWREGRAAHPREAVP